MAILHAQMEEHSIRLSRPGLGTSDSGPSPPVGLPPAARTQRARHRLSVLTTAHSADTSRQDYVLASLEEDLSPERLGNTFAPLAGEEDGGRPSVLLAGTHYAACSFTRQLEWLEPGILSATSCYESRIPWKVRRTLKVVRERLPLSLLTHYESLLRTKVLVAGEKGRPSLQLSISNSFHRMLLHAMACYYGLSSHTQETHLLLIQGAANPVLLGLPSKWFSRYLHERFCR